MVLEGLVWEGGISIENVCGFVWESDLMLFFVMRKMDSMEVGKSVWRLVIGS